MEERVYGPAGSRRYQEQKEVNNKKGATDRAQPGMAVPQESQGAFVKPDLETAPGYFPFLAAFLSAFLAFFAI